MPFSCGCLEMSSRGRSRSGSRAATRSCWPVTRWAGRSARNPSASLSQWLEEGASADYDGDGALVLPLRKQATAQDMAHMMHADTSGGSPDD